MPYAWPMMLESHSDSRLTQCKHPLLREALAFPRRSCVTPPAAPSRKEVTIPVSNRPSIGDFFAQKTLELAFGALAVLAYPFKKLGGGVFTTHKIQIAS
jgi:hypothetical protein